jgi:GNAT superfamily N-acetyltransferase
MTPSDAASSPNPDVLVLFQGAGWQARWLGEDDLPAIEAVLEASREFLELVSGIAEIPGEAQSLLTELPQGTTLRDKLSIGITTEPDGLIGLLDVIRDYPQPRTWWIGLLLFRPEWRGRGLGRQALDAIERLARQAGAANIELGVVEPNQAGLLFWQRMGFEAIERRLSRRFGIREQAIIVMRKALPE